MWISFWNKMKGSVMAQDRALNSFRKLPLWGWPEALATEGSSLDLLHPQGHSCYPIPNVRDLGREWAASQAGNILVRAVLGLRSPLTLSQDMCVCRLSCVWLFETPWTAACHTPLSMGFSSQEYSPVKVAISFSRGSSQPRSWAHVSYVSYIAGRFFTTESLRKSLLFSKESKKLDKKKCSSF